MKKFRINVNDKVFEVEVEEIKEGVNSQPAIKVQEPKKTVSSTPTSTTTKAPQKEEIVKQAKSADELSGEKIMAPLPGTVTVEVAEGAAVSDGEVLFILEAMKMENEITAPVSGTLKAVFVNNGDSVDTGDVLAVIE